MVLILAEPLIYQVSASNQMHGKWLLFTRIFILQQFKLKKNGFRRLINGIIGF